MTRAALPITIANGARQRLRWLLRHGIVRGSINRGVRAGDLGAGMMVDRALIENPFAAYEILRARGRIVPTGLVHVAHDHDLCTAILRSPDFGTVGGPGRSTPAALRTLAALAGPGPIGPIEPPSMLTVDGPDHTRYRKLVTRAFTAKAIAKLRERTEEIAHELLDGIAAAGDEVDLIEEFASLLPATVIAEMLGAPVAMRRQFLEWGAGAALSLDAGLSLRDFRQSERDLRALEDWMREHFDTIRADPGQNILSDLVTAHDSEGTLSDDELLSIAVLLLGAGFETTVNLIGNAVELLTSHPEQLAALRADPARWPNAVDEVLRFAPPVERTGRIAVRDTVVAGEAVPAGRIVLTVIGAANRDPAVFTDPGRFDVTRPNAGEHIAFSSGAHYCLGAGLARMEAEVGLRALFDRFPDLVPAGEPHRRPTRVLRGFDHMPVRPNPEPALT